MSIPFNPDADYKILWQLADGTYIRTLSNYGQFVASQQVNGLALLVRPPTLPDDAVFVNGPYDTPKVPPE